MKRAALEWVEKAEADYAASVRESRARAYDLVCFLAQQVVEKYFKALLEERGATFPRTHDLGHLAALVEPFCPKVKRHARR